MASATSRTPELAGAVTWTMTRQVSDSAAPGRQESSTTTVTMDVVLKVSQSRAGVTLLQAEDGTWSATGTGAAEEVSGNCTLTRATNVDLRGDFASSGNVMTLVHTDRAGRGLLNFSVSKGAGAVTATSRYCDGSEVSQNRTYFWALSDAAVDVVVRRGGDGVLEFVVAKEQTAPCGLGATCTRTASGVLRAVDPRT